MLLLTFPELKREQGVVSEVLKTIGVKDEVMLTWYELVAQELVEPDDDSEFE